MSQLKFDYNNMMSQMVGDEGFDEASIASAKDALAACAESVVSKRGTGWQEWSELPYAPKADIDEMAKFGKEIGKKASSWVVFGIGGSALGPLAVASALLHLRHNDLADSKRKAPKLFVEDNVDPERMNALLDVIDIKTSYFNVITKSGETSETLSQFLIIYKLLSDKLGVDEAKKRIVVTTTIGKGSLYNVAVKEGFKLYGIGGGVGGRFSVLSPVGLLTFAVMGLDIHGILEGARAMTERCIDSDYAVNPALITAYLQVESMKRGKNITVMMPYADSLKFMADFFCQLWGESLGKAKDLEGNVVHVGQTPVKALGVTDQHSQVQLYAEGPFDKVVVFLEVQSFRSKSVIASAAVDLGDFLKDRTLGELIGAEKVATEFALAKAKRLNYTVIFPEVTEHTIGEFLTYLMWQTAYAGCLMGIDTFDQPGVEEGKLATFAVFGRKGYEEKLKEIQSKPKNSKFVM